MGDRIDIMEALKIWLILTLIHTSNTVLPQNGAVVQQKGHLLFIEGTLLVHTDLNQQVFLETNVKHCYDQFTNIGMWMTSHKSPNLTSTQRHTIRQIMKGNILISRELMKHMSKEFERQIDYSGTSTLVDMYDRSWTDFDTRSAVDAPPRHQNFMIYDHNYPVKSRNRRAWVDALGYALQIVAGTATNFDIQNLNATMSNIKKSTLQLQLKTNAIQESVEHSLNYTSALLNKMNSLQQQMESSECYSSLLHASQELSGTLKMLLNTALEVENRIALLKNNLIQPMIEPQQLKTLIENGKQMFNLDFPFEINEAIEYSTYRHKHIFKTFATPDPHIFIIAIPFTDKSKKYDLYQLDGFPTPNVDKEFVIPKINKYLAKSSHDFVVMNNLDLCENVQQTYLCNNLIIKHRDFETCEIALIRQQTQLINETCDYFNVKFEKGFYAMKINGEFLIYFRNRTQGSVICPNQRMAKTYDFYQLTKLNKPCTLHTKEQEFSTTQTHHYNISLQPTLQLPLININVPTIKNHDLHTANVLKNIKTDLITLKQIPQIPLNSTHREIVYTNGAFTIILVIIVIIASVLYFRCLKQSQNSQHSQNVKLELEHVVATKRAEQMYPSFLEENRRLLSASQGKMIYPSQQLQQISVC